MNILAPILRVVVESPFAANQSKSALQHQIYLRHCLRDCLQRGEIRMNIRK